MRIIGLEQVKDDDALLFVGQPLPFCPGPETKGAKKTQTLKGAKKKINTGSYLFFALNFFSHHGSSF